MKKTKTSKCLANKTKGITLIALVVTIVVLLILAAVSITAVFGDNGLLQMAKEAAEKTNEAVQRDKENIGNLTNYIKSLNWDTSKVTAVTTKDGGIVPVPKGFVASEIEGENTIKDGFVIYQILEGQSPDWKEDNDNDGILDVQKEYNQFVWVPVDNPTEMYGIISEDEDGTKNYAGKLYDFSSNGDTPKNWQNVTDDDGTNKTEEVNGITVDWIKWTNKSSSREPDTVDNDASNFNFVQENGYSDFKTQLQKEFNDLVDSVNKYHGFYIGRYETSGLKDEETPIVRADKAPTVATTWYIMYKNSKKIALGNNSVTSSMIWGSQWDAVMNWFLKGTEEEKSYVTNSKGWYNVESGNAEYKTGINLNEDGKIANKVKNIYDMGGNVYEWTIEANHSPGSRVNRGGSYSYSGSDFPASHRGNYYPTESDHDNFGSRVTLYVN